MKQNPESTRTATITLTPGSVYTHASGMQSAITDNDVRQLVAAYNPVADPAPIVAGKPKLDDPAYGWVKSLAYQNGKIVAQIGNVYDKFAAAVRAGLYSAVRASLYPPNSDNNPSPSAWYLKHISFEGMDDSGLLRRPMASFGAQERLYSGATVDLPAKVLSFSEASGTRWEEVPMMKIPQGHSVHAGDAETYRRAMAYMADNPGVSIIEAARRVGRR